MKKSIKLSALLVLFSTSIFAATPGKDNVKSPKNDIKKVIRVDGAPSNIGVTVNVAEQLIKKPVVSISDMDGHQLYTDQLSNNAGSKRTYNMSPLEEGDYTITIFANKQKLTKQVHIYDEDGQKTYFILQ